MLISECKRYKVLPKKGTRVRTVVNSNTEGLPEGKVMDRYASYRISTVGVYLDFVGGSSGDIWWVDSDDGTRSFYKVDEVFDE